MPQRNTNDPKHWRDRAGQARGRACRCNRTRQRTCSAEIVYRRLFAARARPHGQASGLDPPGLGAGDMVARPPPVCRCERSFSLIQIGRFSVVRIKPTKRNPPRLCTEKGSHLRGAHLQGVLGRKISNHATYTAAKKTSHRQAAGRRARIPRPDGAQGDEGRVLTLLL